MQQKILVLDVNTIDPSDTNLQGVINEIVAQNVKIWLALDNTSVLLEQAVEALFAKTQVNLISYAELKSNKWNFDKSATAI